MTRKQKPKRLPNGRFAPKFNIAATPDAVLTPEVIRKHFLPAFKKIQGRKCLATMKTESPLTTVSFFVNRTQVMPGIDGFVLSNARHPESTSVVFRGPHGDAVKLMTMLVEAVAKRPIPVIREGEAANAVDEFSVAR